ncbi:MAG TPA: FKBP-type peptidyl-prolyl cis-trans isomerase [Micropepsaceae bacterium]|nr:FKBP-type peptidyl-prolyl cis-trans isomerase [Micropepsaceae bacterium]
MQLRIIAVAALWLSFAGPALAGDISPEANRELVATNAKKSGVIVLASGLQYRVIKAGTGQTPSPDDTVTVSYKGTRVDGYVFDQTKPGETRNLPVQKLIPGWKEALSLMKEGDEWELLVPAKLAYGDARNDNNPDLWGQALLFDMQLIAVVHPSK